MSRADTPNTSSTASRNAPSHWPPPLLLINPTALLPLPLPADPKLAQQARMHKSRLVDPARDKVETELNSNQRLEWVGDAALHYLVSEALQRLLPRATSGDLSRLRQYLTSNSVFGHLGLLYGLSKTLYTGTAGVKSRPWERELKIVADAFEASICAGLRSDKGDKGELVDVEAGYTFVRALVSPDFFPELELVKKFLDSRTSFLHPETGSSMQRLEDVIEGTVRLSPPDVPPLTLHNDVHTWHDVLLPRKGWTSTLYLGSTAPAVGHGRNKPSAREDALAKYFKKLPPSADS
ncbi:hypothetical protein JCM6882_005199 [Rhodosporidiobolus microsporus]